MGTKNIGGSIRRRASLAAVAVAVPLTLAPAAVAGSGKDSMLSTYGGGSQPLVSVTETKGDGANSGLPNTGLDVAVVIAGGAGIAALGFGLRRLGRQKS